MRQRLHSRLQFHERAELRETRDPARAQLAHLVPGRNRRPRIDEELLQPERDPLRLLFHSQDLDGDLLAGRDNLGRVRHPRPRHLRDVEQALDAGAQVDERPEVEHRGDAPGDDRAGHDRLADLGRPHLLFLLLQRAPRHDEVPATLLVLDDAEGIDVPLVVRRGGIPHDVDLGGGAEGALSGDAHLVTALHRPLDPSLDREPRMKGVFELPRARRAARELAREGQPAVCRHDHRVDPLADGDLEDAVLVLQLVELDDRLALAADVDERRVGADRDDRAFDGLPALETLGFDRRFEQGGEVFLGLGHGALLMWCPDG